MRERRRSSCASCASAASSAGAARFMALGSQPQPHEQPPVALDVRVAGGEQLLAVEDGVRAGELLPRGLCCGGGRVVCGGGQRGEGGGGGGGGKNPPLSTFPLFFPRGR